MKNTPSARLTENDFKKYTKTTKTCNKIHERKTSTLLPYRPPCVKQYLSSRNVEILK